MKKAAAEFLCNSYPEVESNTRCTKVVFWKTLTILNTNRGPFVSSSPY